MGRAVGAFEVTFVREAHLDVAGIDIGTPIKPTDFIEVGCRPIIARFHHAVTDVGTGQVFDIPAIIAFRWPHIFEHEFSLQLFVSRVV